MNEPVVPKMTNFCVVKLSNSPAITCVPLLEPGHFELQPDSLRIDQRLLRAAVGLGSIFTRYAQAKANCKLAARDPCALAIPGITSMVFSVFHLSGFSLYPYDLCQYELENLPCINQQ